MFVLHYIQMIKGKVYLILENLDQLSNLKVNLMPVLLLLIDSYSS